MGLLNFHSSPQQIEGITVPARFASGPGTSPGQAAQMVSDTSVGSQHSFQAMVNGAPRSVTCTVTSVAWVSVNPAVVIQQTGDLTCDGTW